LRQAVAHRSIKLGGAEDGARGAEQIGARRPAVIEKFRMVEYMVIPSFL